MAAVPPVPLFGFTVYDAMVECGVNDATLFMGQTPAVRIAEDCFGNDFNAVMEISYEEFEADLKSYSTLTVANGQIRLDPRTKRMIRAFLQFVRNHYRISVDPSTIPFVTANAIQLLNDEKTHKAFVDKSSKIIETTKPIRFTEKIRWDDWVPTFINFLRSIPGRHGVPLCYVIRNHVVPLIDPLADLLQSYINRAPLQGAAFQADALDVHIYLVNFTAGNVTAETKLLPNAEEQNGRVDFINLLHHYEGVGVNSINIIAADITLSSLYYSGEKKPHMWWNEFETRLTKAFLAYDKKEQRVVYSNEMKLRTLLGKIDADFLQITKSTLNLELNRIPITMTYATALKTFRDEVNRKFPPDLSSGPNRVRRVQETGQGGRGGRGQRDRGRGGRDRGRGRGDRGRGRGGRQYGRGRGQRDQGNPPPNYHPRPGSRNIVMIDGTQMAIHPAVQYSPDVWYNIPEPERENLRRERSEHREQQGRNQRPRTLAAADTQHNEDNRSVPSQVTMGNETIMGGRNEQASIRSRNRGPP